MLSDFATPDFVPIIPSWRTTTKFLSFLCPLIFLFLPLFISVIYLLFFSTAKQERKRKEQNGKREEEVGKGKTKVEKGKAMGKRA